MPANTTPIFPRTPLVGIALGIATNTSRATISGSGTNTVLTPTTTNGLRVDRLVVQLAATSAAAVVTVWLYDGTNQSLIDEIPVYAVTPGNTTPAYRYEGTREWVLEPTQQLYVATTIGQTTNVYAFGGEY